MPDKKKILAIIPARGGSKGIPKKNIVLVGGKPLIAWTIHAAKNSKYINKVVVSSDNDEILKVAAKFGAETIKRPAELATDTALPEPVVHHVLNHLKKEKYIPDILVYLHPTSPLRTHKDINESFDKFFATKATAAISVFELDKKYLKAFTTNNKGFLKGSVNDKYPFMNRQLLPTVYMPNGAIYIITRNDFVKFNRLLSDKTIPHIMTAEKSFDLDTRDDLKKLKRIFKIRAQNHE